MENFWWKKLIAGTLDMVYKKPDGSLLFLIGKEVKILSTQMDL